MPDEFFDALYGAIKHGRLTKVEEFLGSGGDPNLSNCNGWTLLMAASFKGDFRIAALLLDRGANIHATNKVGETALALAAGGGYRKTIKLLLSHGARIDIRPLGQPFSVYMSYAKQPSAEVNNLLADAGII